MKRLVFIVLLVLLQGCVDSGYVKPTHYVTGDEYVLLQWKRTDNPDNDCRKEYPAFQGKDPVLGCSKYQRLSPEQAIEIIKKQVFVMYCKVWSPQVQYVDDDHTMTLGHETDHCFTGNYHQ